MQNTTSSPDGMHASEALWGGRFEDSPTEFTQAFGASLPVDKRMWESDIEGSKAHALMLARQGVISEEDAASIRAGLDAIAAQIDEGDFEFDIDDEDIHMSIERNLTEAIGAAGGRLHTAGAAMTRSRPMRTITPRSSPRALHTRCSTCAVRCLELAEDKFGVVMPGYTHMQKAQPVLFFASYARVLLDVHARFRVVCRQLTRLPMRCPWAAPRLRARPIRSIVISWQTSSALPAWRKTAWTP